MLEKSSAPSSSFSDNDEMSAILRQILIQSSNHQQLPSSQIQSLTASQAPTTENPDFLLQCLGSGLNTVGFCSASEVEEYDCPSEEGLEALVEEATKRRRSSKRRRAAEVHNMSEKRRRSRINEKMKALQNLIPNSNKTDKASMLDEAIEYLKQLQLQVQMLTLRNALRLHPMCLPEPMLSPLLSMPRVSSETLAEFTSPTPDNFFKLRHSSPDASFI